MSVTPLTAIELLAPAGHSARAAAAGDGFTRVLDQLLTRAGEADKQASQAVEDLAAGRADDLHTVALAAAQADIRFRMVLEVRNRLLEAYQEVMRMQV